MLAISNAPKVQPAESSVTFLGRKSAFQVDCLSKSTTLRPFKYDTFHLYRSPIRHSRRVGNNFSARMTLVDERLARVSDLGRQSGVLAYELVQGALVRGSSLMDKSVRDPPTAVLVHGILGCQKNWRTFARRLAQNFPTWQMRTLNWYRID